MTRGVVKTAKMLGAAALALAPALALGGCGPSRDELLAEKVAAAQAAADRAVRAAEAAERAAAASGAKITPTSFADDEPVIEEDGNDTTEFDAPDSELADTGAAPATAAPPAPQLQPAG